MQAKYKSMNYIKVVIIYLCIFPININLLSAKEEKLNTICKKALESYKGYSIYRGDLHVHTNYSADASKDQTIDRVINSAKEKLDFIAITDHDEHLNDVLTKQEWKNICNVCKNNNKAGDFLVIPGYEWTYPDQNFRKDRIDYEHKIIYFDNPPDDIFRFTDFPTPKDLAKAVKIAGGVGHTPHPRSFTVMDLEQSQIKVFHYERNHWDYDCEFSNIFSNAEIFPDGQPYSYDFDKKKDDSIKNELVHISWELEIQKALSMGCKLGILATSDTHWPNVIPGDERRTVVFAKNLSRKNILNALYRRNNYAEIAPNEVDVYFSIAGHIVGEEFEIDKNPELLIYIKSKMRIDGILIYKNNNKWINLTKNDAEHFYNDFKEMCYSVNDKSFNDSSFYYVKIILNGFNEYGYPFTVWTSPIWVNKK